MHKILINKPSFINRIRTIHLSSIPEGQFWGIELENIGKEEILEAKDYVDQETSNYLSEWVFPDDQNRGFITHAILRCVLEELVKEQPLIKRDPFGKPYLEGNPWHFNLSHTKKWAFIGIHPHPIGVDIEAMDTPLGSDFWAAELETALLLPNQPLITLWCAKEALIKATGKGFSETLPIIRKITRYSGDVDIFASDQLKAFIYANQIENQVLAVCIKEETI